MEATLLPLSEVMFWSTGLTTVPLTAALVAACWRYVSYRSRGGRGRTEKNLGSRLRSAESIEYSLGTPIPIFLWALSGNSYTASISSGKASIYPELLLFANQEFIGILFSLVLIVAVDLIGRFFFLRPNGRFLRGCHLIVVTIVPVTVVVDWLFMLSGWWYFILVR